MRSSRWCGIVALGMVWCGIAAVQAAGAQGAPQSGRRWMRGSWALVGGVTRADYLATPALVALDGNTIYVYDGSLKAFGLDGVPHWRFAGGGTGAAALGHVIDVTVDSRHRVWLTEPDEGRILIVDPDGSLASTIDGVKNVFDVVPLSDGSFWATTAASPTPVHFDAVGRRPRAMRLPPDLAQRDPVVALAYLAGAADGAVAVCYYWSSRFVIARRRGRLVHEYRGVERVPFAAVRGITVREGGRTVTGRTAAAHARRAVLDASIDHGVLFELFNAGVADRASEFRTVDAYGVATGRYLGSYRLPEDVVRLRVRDGRFVAITSGRPGLIRVWRWVPGR